MEQFKKNIENLPVVNHIAFIELYEGTNTQPVAKIENKPGKAASVKIYHYLGSEFGGISPKAAEKGLELYAEYVEDARQLPGSHPNIDLLFDIIENNRYLAVKAIRVEM